MRYHRLGVRAAVLLVVMGLVLLHPAGLAGAKPPAKKPAGAEALEQLEVLGHALRGVQKLVGEAEKLVADPTRAKLLAIMRLRELAVKHKRIDQGAELLAGIAASTDDPVARRAALLAASEMYEKVGNVEKAAGAMTAVCREEQPRKPAPKLLRPAPKPKTPAPRAKKPALRVEKPGAAPSPAPPRKPAAVPPEIARKARAIHQWLREHPEVARRIFQSLRAAAGRAPAPSARPQPRTDAPRRPPHPEAMRGRLAELARRRPLLAWIIRMHLARRLASRLPAPRRPEPRPPEYPEGRRRAEAERRERQEMELRERAERREMAERERRQMRQRAERDRPEELEDRRRELEERERTLGRELQERKRNFQRELEDRERQFQRELEKREDELRRTIAEHQDKIRQAEQKLHQAHKELEQRERELRAQEERLRGEAEKLKQAHRHLAEKAKHLQHEAEQFKRQAEEAKAGHGKALHARAMGLKALEQKLEARAAELNARAAQLKALEAKLEAQAARQAGPPEKKARPAKTRQSGRGPKKRKAKTK